jgi:hypothetical protein
MRGRFVQISLVLDQSLQGRASQGGRRAASFRNSLQSLSPPVVAHDTRIGWQPRGAHRMKKDCPIATALLRCGLKRSATPTAQ